ncbi:hypothetical protein [Marinobacter sp.]|uniref:hypothetical protein n=1 Tax=Marinobacter sp. TaxID=50741 RepID=UPI00356792B6
MGISVMVNGWHECDDIGLNAPNVSMSASSMAQVLRAAGLEGKDPQGDGIAANRVADALERLKALEVSLTGNEAMKLLRLRTVNVWSVLAFAQSRNRGVYWA